MFSIMTPGQYKTAINRLGLTQHQAARWLGVSPRTSQSYALGETRIPEPVAKLLRLTIKLKLNPEEMEL
jgi:DNA-binding transcriptional regulator YiaG